jgi:hypothetical protein
MAKVKTVNSLSGGKTSSYIAVHYPADYDVFSLVCIDDPLCAPKDKGIIQYVNDKLGSEYIAKYGEFIATAEDDKTLYVMRDLEQFIGREITWVRGASFDDVIDKGTQTILPSWARRYCTEQMKIHAIFHWWFRYIGERVNMRIGFRFDEFYRIENFINGGDRNVIRMATSCRTYGSKKQKMEDFRWRNCYFPLVKDGITKDHVEKWWDFNGYVNQFFDQPRKMDFPVISNCVGCFHKKPETLCVMANLHPEKIAWFARQEEKEMGTWLDSRITYATLMRPEVKENYIPEMITEGASCDSGGCTD